MKKQINVKIENSFALGNELPLAVIAGPCQVESMDHSLFMVEKLLKIADELKINLIYKSSFDKANRSSLQGARGLGLKKSMEVFKRIKNIFNCPIITDVHTENQCEIVAEYVDVLQIPAFLCRQTDLLQAAAATNKVVNVKKGQFLAPWDTKNIIDKFNHFGNKNLILTERGTSFGYNNLVSDMRSIKIMTDMGIPVVFDATHSVQLPGGKGNASSGQREFVEILARAATSVGIAAVFLEVHQDPDNAPSDGPNMIKLNDFKNLLSTLKKFDQVAKALSRNEKFCLS